MHRKGGEKPLQISIAHSPAPLSPVQVRPTKLATTVANSAGSTGLGKWI